MLQSRYITLPKIMLLNYLENVFCINLIRISLMKFFLIFILLASSKFDLISTIDGQQKISRRLMSNVCADRLDCPPNALCEKLPNLRNGQCVCPPGYIIIGNRDQRDCFRVASTIGESCVSNEQCMITLSTESECRLNRCRCQDGTHFVERTNTCYKSVRIGQFCTFTNNCIGEGVVCSSGKCQCPFGQHANFAMTNCIKDIQLNEFCTYDDECIANYSRCQEKCRCRPGYVSDKNNQTCLKISNHVYDCCTDDVQCQEILPHTKCELKNRTCICQPGFHEIKYRCWVSVPLGGICESDENCATIRDSYCWQGRCVCPENLKTINGKCSSSSKLLSNQRLLIFFIFIYTFYYYFHVNDHC